MIPHIKGHVMDSSGMGRGTYSRIHTRGAKFNVTHSLLQGDQMVFQTMSNVVDNELTYKRPIRFYTEDDTKLFDGLITDINYENIGNDYKKLTGTASGWWQELKGMDLLHPTTFTDETPNAMFAELCRIANDYGINKEARYVYDTDKIPYYNIFGYAYEAPTGADIEFTNVFQAMQEIASYLDVAETLSPYDFGLRIESLPSFSGDTWELTEADVETGIYILPYVLREDGDTVGTYKTFKLEAGLNVRRDYRNICNKCVAIGDGVHSQQLRTTDILAGVSITSADQTFVREEQVLDNHYLQIVIDNPTAFDKKGWVQVTCVLGLTYLVETFPMEVLAGEVATHFTSDRTADGLPIAPQEFLRCVDFNGCVVQVREVTNEATPYSTTIAGKSINEIGYSALRAENMWANTQVRVDALAGKMVRLYHNPTTAVDAPILSKYVSYDNRIGRVVDIYSEFDTSEQPFLMGSSDWSFNGSEVTQRVTGTIHNVLWDAIGNYNLVITAAGEYVIDSTGAQIIAYD